MKFKLIGSLEQLREYRHEWNSVDGDHPFRSWEWNYSWLRTMGSELEPAIVAWLDEDNSWFGIAPFVVDRSKALKLKLRLIGSGSACADYMNLIASPNRYVEVADNTSKLLYQEINQYGKWSDIDEIEFEGIAPDHLDAQYLIDRLPVDGFAAQEQELPSSWMLSLPGEFEELRSGYKASHRRKINKALKKLEHSDYEILSSMEVAFDELWPHFVRLHQRRRTGLGDQGCFAEPRFENFLFDVANELASQGRSELLQANFRGQPMASMLSFKDNERIYMYQTGIEPNLYKYEPGHLLFTAAIQRAILQGYREFDFLRGDESYKQSWNAKPTRLAKIHFVPNCPTAQLRHHIWQSGRAVKGLLSSFVQ